MPKPLNTKELPRFMKTTVAYEKQIEKKEECVKSPRKVKAVEKDNVPRYMQPTKAALKLVEKEEAPAKSAPARAVQPMDRGALPNYMKSTAALKMSEKATEERRREKTEEQQRKEESERELEEIRMKWEKKREEAERRSS